MKRILISWLGGFPLENGEIILEINLKFNIFNLKLNNIFAYYSNNLYCKSIELLRFY